MSLKRSSVSWSEEHEGRFRFAIERVGSRHDVPAKGNPVPEPRGSPVCQLTDGLGEIGILPNSHEKR